MHRLQRLLPRRHAGRAGADLLDGVGDVGLRPAELYPAGGHFVLRQAFLQRRFGVALQLRVDGGAHRVGLRGQAVDAVGLGLAAEIVDEVETGVAMWKRVYDALRQRRCRRTLLLGADDAVLLHAAEHIGQALLGAIGMAVGIVKARPLEQAGEHGAFGQREILRRFAEIAARRHLDAPGAAAEIDGIDIELENVVLADRAFQPRRHDHLADFSLVSNVVADQEVLHHLLGDGRAALRAPGFAQDCR